MEIKKFITEILKNHGFVKENSIKRQITDFRDYDSRFSIHEIIKLSKQIRLLVNIDVEKIRDFPPIFPPIQCNPFFLCATEYLKSNKREFSISVLQNWYSKVQPSSVAEILDSKNPILKTLNPMMAELPWIGLPGNEAKMKREKRAVRHAKQYNKNLNSEDGDYSMGPISYGKSVLEIERIYNVVDSILKRGYQAESLEDNIKSHYLMIDDVSDGDWCLTIQSGTHRVPVLMALGQKTIPILITSDKIIKLSESHEWPAVKAGIISETEAVNLFKRIVKNEKSNLLNFI